MLSNLCLAPAKYSAPGQLAYQSGLQQLQQSLENDAKPITVAMEGARLATLQLRAALPVDDAEPYVAALLAAPIYNVVPLLRGTDHGAMLKKKAKP